MPAYATVAELRVHLPQGTGTVPDATLQAFLDRARAQIDRLLGLSFFDAGAAWPAASLKKVDGESSVWLRLPPYREGSITLLTRLADSTALTDWEERWEAGRGCIFREDGWGGQRYAVTAVWGLGPAPDDLVQLNLELAVNLWRRKDSGSFSEVGVSAVGNTVGGGAIRYVGGLTAQQQAIVAAVRRQYMDPVR